MPNLFDAFHRICMEQFRVNMMVASIPMLLHAEWRRNEMRKSIEAGRNARPHSQATTEKSTSYGYLSRDSVYANVVS